MSLGHSCLLEFAKWGTRHPQTLKYEEAFVLRHVSSDFRKIITQERLAFLKILKKQSDKSTIAKYWANNVYISLLMWCWENYSSAFKAKIEENWILELPENISGGENIFAIKTFALLSKQTSSVIFLTKYKCIIAAPFLKDSRVAWEIGLLVCERDVAKSRLIYDKFHTSWDVNQIKLFTDVLLCGFYYSGRLDLFVNFFVDNMINPKSKLKVADIENAAMSIFFKTLYETNKLSPAIETIILHLMKRLNLDENSMEYGEMLILSASLQNFAKLTKPGAKVSFLIYCSGWESIRTFDPDFVLERFIIRLTEAQKWEWAKHLIKLAELAKIHRAFYTRTLIMLIPYEDDLIQIVDKHRYLMCHALTQHAIDKRYIKLLDYLIAHNCLGVHNTHEQEVRLRFYLLAILMGDTLLIEMLRFEAVGLVFNEENFTAPPDGNINGTLRLIERGFKIGKQVFEYAVRILDYDFLEFLFNLPPNIADIPKKISEISNFDFMPVEYLKLFHLNNIQFLSSQNAIIRYFENKQWSSIAFMRSQDMISKDIQLSDKISDPLEIWNLFPWLEGGDYLYNLIVDGTKLNQEPFASKVFPNETIISVATSIIKNKNLEAFINLYNFYPDVVSKDPNIARHFCYYEDFLDFAISKKFQFSYGVLEWLAVKGDMNLFIKAFNAGAPVDYDAIIKVATPRHNLHIIKYLDEHYKKPESVTLFSGGKINTV